MQTGVEFQSEHMETAFVEEEVKKAAYLFHDFLSVEISNPKVIAGLLQATFEALPRWANGPCRCPLCTAAQLIWGERPE